MIISSGLHRYTKLIIGKRLVVYVFYIAEVSVLDPTTFTVADVAAHIVKLSTVTPATGM
jgi:hypothetical protein